MRNGRPRRGRYFVYLVQCADGTYYGGSTNNVEHRIKRHNAGTGAKYVRGRGPVELVYAKAYRSHKQAMQAERLLKTLTRTRKEALISVYASTKRP